MRRGIGIWRKEPVLCVVALCALGSMLAVPPSAAYSDYIDWKVLALLWCLMAVILVLLPFFTSTLVTNDVALLTFVPFTLLLLESAHCAQSAIPILVLQTIAANLGSMAMPVASLASLITLKLYLKREEADGKRFLLWFTPANLGAIAVLLLCVRLWK